MAGSRLEVLAQIADLICAVEFSPTEALHPVRVAVDGVDASGKTTLADELVPLIAAHGRPVIRASVDGFHNPREVRYRRGADSPEGYYRDSFDYAALQRDLLHPLGPGGSREYLRAAFNYQEDATTAEPWRVAPVNAILLFDGVFLLRPELISHWDYAIFLHVDFDISVPRAVERDVANGAGQLTPQMALAKYNQRYVPGQKIYLAEACPHENAQLVVDNSDWANPKLIIP